MGDVSKASVNTVRFMEDYRIFGDSGAYMFAYICVYMFVFTFYADRYIYIYVYAYIYIYIYIYIYRHSRITIKRKIDTFIYSALFATSAATQL